MDANIQDRFPKLAKTLGHKGLEALDAHSRLITVPSQTTLVQCGEPQEALYLLVEGCCAVSIEGGVSCADLGMLREGDWIGKQSFFDSKHAGCATVITTCEASLLEIRHEDFAALKEHHIQTASSIVRLLVDAMTARIRATNELLEAEKLKRPSDDDEEAVSDFKTRLRRLLSMAIASLSGSESEAS